MDSLTLWFEPTLVSNEQRRIYDIIFGVPSKRRGFTQVNLRFKVVHFLELENRKTLFNPINKWFIIFSSTKIIIYDEMFEFLAFLENGVQFG